MRERIVLTACAVGGLLLGPPYCLHLFGPTEVEVAQWGFVSIIVGIILSFLGIVVSDRHAGRIRYVIVAALLLMALLQLPPALLWVLFHGTGISDGSPPSDFVANWAFALPHMALLGACTIGLAYVIKRTGSGEAAGA